MNMSIHICNASTYATGTCMYVYIYIYLYTHVDIALACAANVLPHFGLLVWCFLSLGL